MNTTVQKAIRAEYVLLRTPLALLDERVLTRLGADSKVRTTLERGIATLDAAAARFLGESTREPEAEPVREPEPVPAAEVEALAEELLEEQAAEHNLAGELAEDEELRRVQAELQAKHRVEEEHGH